MFNFLIISGSRLIVSLKDNLLYKKIKLLESAKEAQKLEQRMESLKIIYVGTLRNKREV